MLLIVICDFDCVDLQSNPTQPKPIKHFVRLEPNKCFGRAHMVIYSIRQKSGEVRSNSIQIWKTKSDCGQPYLNHSECAIIPKRYTKLTVDQVSPSQNPEHEHNKCTRTLVGVMNGDDDQEVKPKGYLTAKDTRDRIWLIK